MTITPQDTVALVPNAGWDARILVCRCGELVDTCIVVSERYVIVIDTLINTRTALALLELAQPYLSHRQLLVVNTHADWDHAWGNHVFSGPQAIHPAPIIATQRCAERLSGAAQQTLADMRLREPERFADVHLTAPMLLFDQRMQIAGGDLTLELFATPGHQPDHLSVFIPEIQTLLAGDAAEMPFPFVESAVALPALRDSLQRMWALQPRTALYCHAPGEASPALLQQNIAYFDTVEQHCRAFLAQGGTVPDAADTDLEALLNLPFAASIQSAVDIAALERFYRPGHQAMLRAMLEYLSLEQ